MSQVEFVDVLPPRKSRQYAEFHDELVARKGSWAAIGNYKSVSSATSMASYFKKNYGARGFEFTNRDRMVYARFIGVKVEEAEA